MVRHSVDYQKLVREGMAAGRYISIAAGEYLSGLPKNWTSPHAGAVDVQQVRSQFPDASQVGMNECESCSLLLLRLHWEAASKLKCISLFSGCGGLELGVKKCPPSFSLL